MNERVKEEKERFIRMGIRLKASIDQATNQLNRALDGLYPQIEEIQNLINQLEDEIEDGESPSAEGEAGE